MAATAPSPTLVPSTIGKYTVVRFLEAERSSELSEVEHVEHYLARPTAGGLQAPLLVLERVTRAHVSAADLDAFTRRARRIAMLRHPNVPRVRDVFTTSEHAVVVTELLEGKRWSTLEERSEARRKKPLSLEARLKLLLDVVSALAALHALRDPGWSAAEAGPRPPLDSDPRGPSRPAFNQVPSMIHGGVAPSTILIGTDGVARLLQIHRPPLRQRAGALDDQCARSAPEVLLGDGTADGRADVYSIGVMLWETLAGRRLFTQPTVSEMLSRQLAGDLPAAPSPTFAPWANALVHIAATALAVDPKRRYANAIELGIAMRNATAHRLPPASEIAHEVREILGTTAPRVPTPDKTTHGLGPVTVPLDVPPVPPVQRTSVLPDLSAIDDRWSQTPPLAPMSKPAAPPLPRSAPDTTAPLRIPPPVPRATAPDTTMPLVAPIPRPAAPPALPVVHASTPPARPSIPVPRPSDITALKPHAARRRRRVLLLGLVLVLLLVSVCTAMLLVTGSSRTKEPQAAAPSASASARPALALAQPATPSAEPPVASPPPQPIAPSPRPAARPAAAPTAYKSSLAPAAPNKPAAAKPAAPSAAPPAPRTAPAAAPSARATATEKPAAPSTKPRSRKKHESYVPLGI